jgi:hypothetical protein
MKSEIIKTINTVKREGVSAAFRKTLRRLRYIQLRKKFPSYAYIKKWQSIKNKYVNKRVFLIGNGPSLNKTPLHLLQNEHVMCFNRFNLMLERINWKPDFYMITDNLLLDDMIPEIKSICEYTDSCFLPDIHFRGYEYRSKVENDSKIYWLVQKHGQNFSKNLPVVHMGGSVIYEGFQVLRHLGFSEVYFIGVDMDFKIHKTAKSINKRETDILSTEDDDPNHFDPRYFGKNRKYHQPEAYVIDSILENLKYLSENHTSDDFKIINAGYDSKVDFFPKTDFRDLFKITVNEEKQILDDFFKKKSVFNSLEEFSKAAQMFNQIPEVKPDSHFILKSEYANQVIKDYLFTHIPVGPFDDKYCFIKK